MKEKKKGFTLIELLAVIVILAIIALIATPIVLNLIQVARKGAFNRSAEGVLKSAKLYYSQSLLEVEGATDISFRCNNGQCVSDKKDDNDVNIALDVDGNMGTGDVQVYSDGTISLSLSDGIYCAEKSRNESKITVSKKDCSSTEDAQIYYEYGQPTTSSTTDYTTLGKNIFAKLQGEQLSICLVENGVMDCFDNNFEKEAEHMVRYFGVDNCGYYSGRVDCLGNGHFTCMIYENGDLNCGEFHADDTMDTCTLYSDNRVECYQI